MWLLIEESLPEHPLAAEAVLHVRRHLRTLIKSDKESAPYALAMLLGAPWESGSSKRWQQAASDPSPLQAGAQLIAPDKSALSVSLGHDDAHVESCRAWMSRRVRAESAFDHILADDLATLLALSTAMDLATARQHDRQACLPVLIQGETGTGKELLAEAIHNYWKKHTGAEGDFHVMQVAGISPNQIYTELFGAAQGAYTGLKKDRKGRVEVADGGTLLVDEVGDLPAEAQVALLRFLQTGRFQRLGETKERSVQVRIIAATWHDLDTNVTEHRFRLDLLHRIRGGGSIVLPPLRERAPFDSVVDKLLGLRDRTPRLTRSARDALRFFPWPGNLRELVSVVDTMVAFARADEGFRIEHLPTYLQRHYLSLPLRVRAPGIICDVNDEQELTSTLISARIARISEMFFSQAEVKESELSVFESLLSQLVDVNEDNGEARRRVSGALKHDIDSRRYESVAQHWSHILEKRPLPDEVQGLLRTAIADSRAKKRAATEGIRQNMQDPSVANNTWLIMLQDLKQSPLLSHAPPGAITSAMVFLHNTLLLYAPDLPRELASVYRKDKFRGMLRHAIDKLEELEKRSSAIDADTHDNEHDDDYDGNMSLPDQPKDWPEDLWRQLSEVPTLKEAKDISGFDPKTIYRYFNKYDLVPAWKKKAT